MLLQLSKKEKLELENNMLKEQNLQSQFTLLQIEKKALIDNYCARNSKKSDDIVNINLQNGTVEFKEKEEVKENRKKG